MKIHAYIMAADPAWIEASVLSYYDSVDKIVVSYAEDGVSWSGTPIRVNECLERLRAIDKASKFSFEPGIFYSPDRTPMQSDTFQRQCALDSASEGADWVLQLDTDEVLFDKNTFWSCLEEAQAKDFRAMLYPARWIYQHLSGNDYLELCNYFGKVRASFPGPVAIKGGAKLHTARQANIPSFRVDFAAITTDSQTPSSVRIDRVIAPDSGIIHFSQVRSEESLRRKFESWSHSKDYDWEKEMRSWRGSRKNVALRCLLGAFQIPNRRPVRRVTLPMPDFILPQYRDED